MADATLKSAIPTKELRLDNGEVVVLYSYMTTGESRQLQKKMLEGGKFNPQTSKLEDLSVSTFLDIQDLAADFIIKEIKKADNTTVPFSREWLDNLPVEMGNIVYEAINEVTQTSQLGKDAKKD